MAHSEINSVEAEIALAKQLCFRAVIQPPPKQNYHALYTPLTRKLTFNDIRLSWRQFRSNSPFSILKFGFPPELGVIDGQPLTGEAEENFNHFCEAFIDTPLEECWCLRIVAKSFTPGLTSGSSSPDKILDVHLIRYPEAIKEKLGIEWTFRLFHFEPEIFTLSLDAIRHYREREFATEHNAEDLFIYVALERCFETREELDAFAHSQGVKNGSNLIGSCQIATFMNYLVSITNTTSEEVTEVTKQIITEVISAKQSSMALSKQVESK